MNEEEVASILSSLSRQGIDINREDGIDVIRDYFANRDRESDSDSDTCSTADEGDHSLATVDESQLDAAPDVPDVVAVELTMPDVKHLYTEILNADEEKTVMSYVQNGCCGCHLGPGNGSCLSQFAISHIVENRLNCFELDYMHDHENRLNTVIVAELNALLHRDEKLMCSNFTSKSQKDRQKQKLDYKFRGYSVCMKGFLFLHGIGRKRLRLLRHRVATSGIQPVLHGNTGRVPYTKVQTFSDVKRVVTFIQNYAENNALILPGRVAGHRNSSLQLLPSWETKKQIHDLYKSSCPNDCKLVGYHSFIRIWKAALPNIVIQLPRTDLCLTCQQDTVKISQLANMDEVTRTERIQKSLDHLNLVKQERQVYVDTIEKCKQILSWHPTKLLGSLPQGQFTGSAHISFDFAQQVHVPNLPDQPGPLYFLTPYKIGIFGINNEAVGRQINYVIPESIATGKGPNAIASMLHHYLENFSLGESILYIHADNCVGQNKNNVIMHYLCWRILSGLNKYIRIMFMPVGHTKFSPDGGFGLIKSKFRRSLVCTADDLCDCIRQSTPVSKMNQAVLVGTEAGIVSIPNKGGRKQSRSSKRPEQKVPRLSLTTRHKADTDDERQCAEKLQPPKRKPQTCSYCLKSGHCNRILRGKPSCPLRLVDEEYEK